MMTPAAFSGDYCDLKFVKTRKVAQITIEIPIEQAAAFVASFGAPDPSQGVPVAIARLKPGSSAGEQGPLKPEAEGSNPSPAANRKKWDDLPYSQQAAIRCGEMAFWRFLRDEKGYTDVFSPPEAASAVRHYCSCDSRKELDTKDRPQADWLVLDSHYQAWLRAPV